MNKYTLEEFVNLCNDCTYQIDEETKDLAYKVGEDFGKLFNAYKNDEDIEKVVVCEDNREFFKRLLARKDALGNTITDEYTFMQDKNIIARINVFEAFTEANIFSQKWHVLISLLALIDTANYDDNSTLLSKYAKGKINSIYINKEKNTTTIKANREATYSSGLMNEWIREATKDDVLDS